MIKYILFDMDGVLINTEPLHYKIWKQILEEYGVDMEYDKYKLCIGSTRAFLYDLLWREYGINFHKEEGVFERFKTIKNEIIKREGTPRIEGVQETIKYLYEKGYRMAVASSSSQDYIELHMNELHLTKYFHLLFSAERVKNPKPAPDVFLETAKRMGANTKECLVIEDSYNGSRAAKAAGMVCYGFQNPDSGHQDLSAADKIFEKFTDLMEML